MENRAAIILAAGQGKRMKSKHPKVLHLLAGLPMISYVTGLADRLDVQETFVIVGHQAEQVSAALGGGKLKCLLQDPPRGTGHAVLQAKEPLSGFSGSILILSGDTPLLREETLRRLWGVHQKERATLTLLTARFDSPSGYGRIVRGLDGNIERVVEEKDATPEERLIEEVNTGVYIVEAAFLFPALEKIKPNNQQNEYYLTDIIQIATGEGKRLAASEAAMEETLGVNSRADLAKAEKILRRRINAHWMAEGVNLIDPERTQIGGAVTIGRDTIIYPEVILEGATEIGEDCVLHSARIRDSRLEPGVIIKDFCVIEASRIETGASIGPFAHLRPGTLIRKGAKVGNFVEIKKSELGEGAKANHLTYLGDTIVGKNVNIGAGAITCNYDGENKHQTIIEEGVFIGSDTQLIAPVRIGAGSLIAAGSTITKDVPPDSLAISRAPQENKIGWTKKRASKEKKDSGS